MCVIFAYANIFHAYVETDGPNRAPSGEASESGLKLLTLGPPITMWR